MAIMLGALVVLGIQPGPMMMVDRLDLVWTLIWTLVLANLLCVFVFLAIAPWLGAISFIRGGRLIPFVFALTLLGAYLSQGRWENLILLGVLSLVGYALLRFGWPRAPFVIGLVLGPIAEDSLHKALAIWGGAFFLRPLSLILIALIVLSLLFPFLRRNRKAVDHAAP